MARKRGPKKPTGPTFQDAPQVRDIAARLINKHHTHLAEARIAYLFRTGNWKANGKIVFGRAVKVTGANKFLTEQDFAIIINSSEFNFLRPELQEALIDHELCHCARGMDDTFGRPTWTIVPHDTEDFIAVIRRNGLWTAELKSLEKAAGEHEEQLKLINLDDKRAPAEQSASAR